MHALQLIDARTCPPVHHYIITLDGSDLEYVDNVKYLGVWLDCKLSFQTQIKHLQFKLTLESGSYFATKPPSLTKHTLVKRTIQPILD